MKTAMTVMALAASAVLLVACSKKEEGQKGAAEIMKDYTTTLSTAPDKARDVGEKTAERANSMEKAAEELDK